MNINIVPLMGISWTAAHQASLPITNFWGLLKLMSVESVMPSNHLILYHPLLPLILPRFRVFSNESVLHIRWPKYWTLSYSISPSNEYSGLISFRIHWSHGWRCDLRLCCDTRLITHMRAGREQVCRFLSKRRRAVFSLFLLRHFTKRNIKLM